MELKTVFKEKDGLLELIKQKNGLMHEIRSVIGAIAEIPTLDALSLTHHKGCSKRVPCSHTAWIKLPPEESKIRLTLCQLARELNTHINNARWLIDQCVVMIEAEDEKKEIETIFNIARVSLAYGRDTIVKIEEIWANRPDSMEKLSE
ncbi:MAG: hypothetical protein UU65_C0002G0280 [candidate division CPR2 bacterium GW2011_GWC1_41_48]|uniref:Uncharacterized protein n=1 Tax=candidate division CPR2 bacterium GW2011_GWC1_41_48 TaxID=1618344 RepID=A0A0G0WBQ0_UNCC2|nr:MAG: hypothetical protein UT47_C0002G0024 [candidate division CPR2 bacterium GW2011_GWC2_39_35]KKR27230.1 MAG: hypothetical protein UT59_C0065G0004 [candidate division CPR2 bacterium GW2011_GWD1_39_7]KKR29005.1 MAG: hypothetical protein UT60_C0008G0048 [candidate division CPR2 bacterium GW2011_GWD2_39_7]KKS09502.1 MAG: hypothetical protein UU65_C0002G0280 [candidate division CPR2 bacterium GW2011_GWC1_41_48]OGB57447.1 MAG: hypothetical protein A2Y27_00300 [candidate division CPR2 bacterium G